MTGLCESIQEFVQTASCALLLLTLHRNDVLSIRTMTKSSCMQGATIASQALTWRELWQSGGAWIVYSGVWTMYCILALQTGVHPSYILTQS